jgi:hypothetical protein
MFAKATQFLLLSTLVCSSTAFTPSSRLLTGALISTKSVPLTRSDWRLHGVPEDDEMESEETRAEHEMASLDLSKTVYTASIKSPKDSYVAFAEKGAANAKMAKRKIFHQSVLGGCYVGFGALLSLSVAGTLVARCRFLGMRFPVASFNSYLALDSNSLINRKHGWSWSGQPWSFQDDVCRPFPC